MSSLRTASIIKKEAGVDPANLRLPALESLYDSTERARAEAIRQGYEEGRQRAAQEIDEQRALMRAKEQFALSSAAAALEDAVEAVVERLNETVKDLETEISSLVFDLARAVIGCELSLARNPGEAALARALALVPPDESAVVRLNPDDLSTIESANARTWLQLVPDPQIERGGSVIEVGAMRIDARIETALDRARTLLESALSERTS